MAANSLVYVRFILPDGVLLRYHGKEALLPFTRYPVFMDHKNDAIKHVEEVTPSHFHWPDCDVDITVDMIEHPDRYPLIAKT